MRVKLFKAFGTWDNLEEDINKWLEREGKNYIIVDIKYSTCVGNVGCIKCSALVLYKTH